MHVYVAPGVVAISEERTNGSKMMSHRHVAVLFLCSVLPTPLKVLVQ